MAGGQHCKRIWRSACLQHIINGSKALLRNRRLPWKNHRRSKFKKCLSVQGRHHLLHLANGQRERKGAISARVGVSMGSPLAFLTGFHSETSKPWVSTGLGHELLRHKGALPGRHDLARMAYRPGRAFRTRTAGILLVFPLTSSTSSRGRCFRHLVCCFSLRHGLFAANPKNTDHLGFLCVETKPNSALRNPSRPWESDLWCLSYLQRGMKVTIDTDHMCLHLEGTLAIPNTGQEL